jgi:hypothetical protein
MEAMKHERLNKDRNVAQCWTACLEHTYLAGIHGRISKGLINNNN